MICQGCLYARLEAGVLTEEFLGFYVQQSFIGARLRAQSAIGAGALKGS